MAQVGCDGYREGDLLLDEVHAKRTCTVGNRNGGAGLREARESGCGVIAAEGAVDRVRAGHDEGACPDEDARGD